MDGTTDPRIDFARRLRALQETIGLSLRRLEVESERTPRRRGEGTIRLKRSTIAGMTNLERPVRPQLPNFEVFVDTCLRVAAEKDISLPPELGDREAWNQAYRDLGEYVDRYPRKSMTPHLNGGSPAVEDAPHPAPANAKPLLTRRRVLLATPVTLVVAAAVLSPWWLREQQPSTPDDSSDDGVYSPLGRLLSGPLAKDDPVWSVAVGALKSEALAIVGRADGTLQLWSPVTGRARSKPLAGHDQPVYSIALNGAVAVTGSVDGTLRRWDLTTDSPTSVRLGDKLDAGVNSVALGTVDGRPVAVSAGDDRTVRVWQLTTPELTGTILGEKLDSEVKSIAVGTINGATVAVSGSADGSIRLWDVTGRSPARLLGAHQSTVGTVAIGATRNRVLAVTGSEDGYIRRWDLTATHPTGTVFGDRIYSAVKTVAIGTVKGTTVAIAGSDDTSIRLWDLATGHTYGNGLTGPKKGAESIAIGNVGDVSGRAVVVSGHWDGTIWTWNL
ncbi:WD40 repeat domain-containing protein [Amycolatopsis sp. NPDC051128]|uniref:WD40 repeat domain-containing protein n=1 Tax=Amycolatopsis sp. NPDC051128 TaxID=3155412 RepID=UPI00343FCF79